MDELILKQDLIDAFEALDWYHQNRNKDMVHGANSSEHQAWYKADDIYKMLEALPSAQPEDKCGECDAWNQYKNYPRQQWIPCSERLPEEEEDFLVTDGESMAVGYYRQDAKAWDSADFGWIENREKGYGINEVIAWMPLPEPYAERRTDD